MAKVLPINLPITGSFGAYSVYNIKGIDKRIIRRKGGATKEKFLRDPGMKGSRESAKIFTGNAKAGKMIRHAIHNVKHLAHSYLSSELVGVCKTIMAMDLPKPENGMQSIVFSKGIHLLQGYNLNKEKVFDSIVSTPVLFDTDRDLHKVIVRLPQLIPGKNFKNAWDQPFFRFKLSLGIIRDMIFDGHEYVPITPDVQEYSVSADSDWTSVKDGFAGQTMELKIEDPVFDEHCHLVLAIGIEFGSPLRGGISAVKDAGCAKILDVF